MGYTYSAIFTEDNRGNCHISIPDLEYETYVSYSSPEELRSKASEELGFALWLYESSGKVIPVPTTISEKGIPHEGYIGFITCDYKRYKESIREKEIPLD